MLFSCTGGAVHLPDPPLIDRGDGGNLVIQPPRDVWDRIALSQQELIQWAMLVAATADAMLTELPQLYGGCINYWDAGNWALNEGADPQGPKTAQVHRRLHLHLIGRSRSASDPSWRWGEAPVFPRYRDRETQLSRYEPLTDEECNAVIARLQHLLADKYSLDQS